jgi:hypothetical protein
VYLRVAALALRLLFGARSAWSGTVYLETHQGETACPLSPDIDVLGLGGGIAPLGEGTPAAPTLTGTSASASVTNVTGTPPLYESAGVGIGFGPVFDLGQPYTITGSFAGFNVTAAPATQTAAAFVAVGFTTLFLYNSDLAYTLSANVEQLANENPNLANLTLYENLGGATIASGVAVIPIFAEGIPFDLQLFLDPDSSSAFARFTSGALTMSTPAVTLIAYGAQRPDSLLQILGLANQGSGPGDVAVVDFTELRVDTVREPSLAWLAALAFAGLALRRRG